MTGNIYTGLFDFPEMSFLLHALRQTDRFIDVGANAGCYSILASKVVGAKTYAFEPVPETFQRLVENVHINGIEQQVMAFNKGLSDKRGSLSFSAGLDSMNHVLRPGESLWLERDTVDVDVVALDELQMPRAFLMKVDVEGYEFPVLMGAKELMSDGHLSSVILELNDSGDQYGYKDSEILSFMKSLDFFPYRYDPCSRELTRLDGKDVDSKNTIFVRDYESVLARLRSGPQFRVFGKVV